MGVFSALGHSREGKEPSRTLVLSLELWKALERGDLHPGGLLGSPMAQKVPGCCHIPATTGKGLAQGGSGGTRGFLPLGLGGCGDP